MTGRPFRLGTLAFPVCAAVVLSGCTVGPDYHRPSVSTPARYDEAGTQGDAVPADTDAGLAVWWTRLGDPMLNDLVRRALSGNPDQMASASRVREARLNERVAASDGLPKLNANANVVDLNSGGTPVAGLTLPSHTTIYAAGFDASWEVDLFGETRRSVEAARANTAAADWARRDAQVSLVAEVASDYLTLRILQARIALGQAELQRQQDLFRLVQARQVTGFVTLTDVNQQSRTVAAAAAALPRLDAEARVEIHALGVLVGQPPEYLARALQPTAADLPVAGSGLPRELPSDLLRRRPDIREAERRIAAASANIGVNEAELYPKLNLLGFATFGSKAIGNIFSTRNLLWGGLGMGSMPIFDGGRIRAQIAMAKEEDAQAVYAYESKVFSAFRDVEDALARYHAEDARRVQIAGTVVSAARDVAIAQHQYDAGTIPYMDVLRAQVTLLNNRDDLVQSNGQVLTDLISLYKALGGGWSDQIPAAANPGPGKG